MAPIPRRISPPPPDGSISFLDVLVFVLMVAILFTYLRSHYGEVELVRSKVDGRKYIVRKLPDSQAAADALAEINAKLTRLVQHMMAKYGKEREGVIRMYRNFNPENVSEGGLEHGYTSYSVNKGEKLVLCIRQKDNSFVSSNTMMYVAVHELAHLMTLTVGHDRCFWTNFRFLLNEAVDIGIYRKVNFSKKPQDYCGIRITSSVI